MEVLVRRAHPEDKGPLMSFIRNVWGGHDYIPTVWDDWMRDRRGRVYVVVADGVPVGMNRLSFLDDGTAWFQGVRIHPQYRGLGLATLLGNNSMAVALKRGVRVFRLTTASRNFASRRQVDKMKFEEVARFSVYEPPAGFQARKARVERLSGRDIDAITELIRGTEEYRLGAGVHWHNFAAISLTRQVVQSLAAEEAIWRLRGAVAVVRAGGEGAETWEQVCFVGGPERDCCELVEAAVGRIRAASVRWIFVPQGSQAIHALRKEGFRRLYSQILFERHAANG